MRRTIHNSLTAEVQEWAAIYERASDPDGGAQDKYSIPEQDRLCKQWVADEGMQVYDIYLDIGGKGDDLHRPGLERLRRDLRAGRFATVVVNEYDRFSRDSGITSIVLHEAREHDVRVVFVQEPDANDDTPMGRLLLWFKGWKAEEEHAAIRQRTQRGLRARARAGKLIPGSFPQYGYLYGDAKKTHYILDEETAQVVRRIFRDFVRGKSLQHIADDLAREGIVSPGRRAQLKGWAYLTYKDGTPRPPLPARWRVTTLRRLLKWPGYCGHHAAYRHSSGFIKKRDPLTGDVKRVHHMRLRDETDEAYIPLPDGVCPPLVSRELWEQAQARLRYNQEEAARNNHQPQATLLRGGFVCCGHCGHSLYVHVMNDGYAYHCDNRHSPTCRGGGTARQTPLLDGEAWAQVKAMLHDTARIRGLYDDMVEGTRERAEGAASTLRAIESRITELTANNANLLARTERLTPGTDDDLIAMYEQRMAANARELRQQEARRAEVSVTVQHQQESALTRQTFEAWAADVLPFLDDLPMQTKRVLMRNLGVKVVLWRHDVKLRSLVLFGWDETLASYGRGDQRLHLYTTLDALDALDALEALEVLDGPDGEDTVDGAERTWADVRAALQRRLDPVLAYWNQRLPAAIRAHSSWGMLRA